MQKMKKDELSVYAAYAKDKQLRIASSSGALFSLLANKIIEEGGIVYGVAMTDDCYGAEYRRVTSIEGLVMLRGSKYFQAKVGNTYKQVKGDLEDGYIVFFTGTGCYVNGLKSYLSKEYSNLYCMDIICHGTPSPKLWKEYVEYREEQNSSKMIYASFRNKDKHDWNGFEMKEIDDHQREVYISRHVDPYFSLFVKNICLRPSCYECRAKELKTADITVGDFWGIDKVAPEMNDNLGISLAIIRTNNGKKLFKTIQDDVIVKEVSYEDGVRDNKSEYQSYLRPSERDKFFDDMGRLSFGKLADKYINGPFWKKCIKRMYRILKNILGGVTEHNFSHEDYGMLLIFVNDINSLRKS